MQLIKTKILFDGFNELKDCFIGLEKDIIT